MTRADKGRNVWICAVEGSRQTVKERYSRGSMIKVGGVLSGFLGRRVMERVVKERNMLICAVERSRQAVRDGYSRGNIIKVGSILDGFAR